MLVAMLRNLGLCALLMVTLSACENAKDLPLLSRYIAKNVCGAIAQEGYSQAAAIDYVSNIAPPLKNSWNIAVDQNVAVRVRNKWFTWLPAQTAMPANANGDSDCRNVYTGVTVSSISPENRSSLQAGFVDAINPDSELQRYLDLVVERGAPEFTTAVLVLYQNQVVAEAYRDGLDQASPLKGFSMSKSFANLLVGRLSDQQKLQVNEPLLLAGWANDARSNITWDHSLRMSSGLLWHEAAIGEDNDQGQMFYNSADPSAYAREKPYSVDPATAFNYSSGDYMNISTALMKQDGWFDPGWSLDQHFALEYSPDGQVPLLAEGVYLTTRGWAAMASLYMHNGQLAGESVLSPQWVDYSLTPSDTNFDYGAGIWLNRGQSLFPLLPPDTFAFIGSYDRYTVAIPQYDLVVVRFGFSAQPGDFDMQEFIVQVIERL